MKKFLQTRREKFSKHLKNGEMAIIFANFAQVYPRYFLQENNFFYLTGLDEPDLIFLAVKFNGETVFKLFVQRTIPERVVWEGKKISPEKASELSGIKEVKYLDEFESVASSYLASASVCYLNNLNSSYNALLNKSQNFVQMAKKTFYNITFKDIYPIMSKLRAVKDKVEIENLRKAIDATRLGIESIYENAKAGMHEYELEAMLIYEINRKGLKHLGFKSIVAAGHNATTLHYEKNRDKIKKGSLVLLDVGAKYQNYSADISRTFPIEKDFSPRQKDIYAGVLSVQKAIINEVKPGIGLMDLQNKTKKLLTEVLIDLKLIKSDKELSKYYMHGVSHHLGMDTHDIVGRNSILEKGNVITVEPGLYIPEESIGVRIEDDILVTKNGFEVLSAAIPKEIEELKGFRK